MLHISSSSLLIVSKVYKRGRERVLNGTYANGEHHWENNDQIFHKACMIDRMQCTKLLC